MNRLYLKESRFGGDDPDYAHVLSDSKAHLNRALGQQRVCEIGSDGRSFACHLDSYRLEGESLQFDLRLFGSRDQALALIEVIAARLSQSFSLWVLPADARTDMQLSVYRIVNVRHPAEVRVSKAESKVRTGHGVPIECRSMTVWR